MNREQLTVEREIGGLMARRRGTLAAAESCTGGLVSARLTSVGGSSAWFLGGVVAYANDVKIGLLGISRQLLDREGAVSEAVAKGMAAGIRTAVGADIGVGVTGIAGPAGGTAARPVGLVYIALAADDAGSARRFNFDGDRSEVRNAAAAAALEMIRDYLAGKPGDMNREYGSG